MIRYRVLQLLFLVSSMTSQVMGMMLQDTCKRSQEEISIMTPQVKRRKIEENLGMLPAEEVSSLPFKVEGIAQKIEELPKELRYNIFSSALELRENSKYEVYRDFNVGSEVTGIALNADNTRALTGSTDGIARIWDVEKGTVLKELKGHKGHISSVALSADGTLALTGSWDETARIWNTDTGELLKTLQVGSAVYSVALSADGAIALTGSYDTIARLYTSTGELLKVLKGHTETITSVALSADGTLALTGSDDATARVWDTTTGEFLKTLQARSWVTSVALSAGGTIALIGTCDFALVWDFKTDILLNTLLLTTDSGSIHSVALSKDGKRALTGTEYGSMQLWNTQPLPGQRETNTPLTVLEGHIDSVTAVACGGADFIASGSKDNTALIWKPFALEPRGPQENVEILRQAYKEIFSRPKFLFQDEK